MLIFYNKKTTKFHGAYFNRILFSIWKFHLCPKHANIKLYHFAFSFFSSILSRLVLILKSGSSVVEWMKMQSARVPNSYLPPLMPLSLMMLLCCHLVFASFPLIRARSVSSSCFSHFFACLFFIHRFLIVELI